MTTLNYSSLQETSPEKFSSMINEGELSPEFISEGVSHAAEVKSSSWTNDIHEINAKGKFDCFMIERRRDSKINKASNNSFDPRDLDFLKLTCREKKQRVSLNVKIHQLLHQMVQQRKADEMQRSSNDCYCS
jgi:hypothetical protein